MKTKLKYAHYCFFAVVAVLQFGCCTTMYCSDGVNVLLYLNTVDGVERENFVLKWQTSAGAGEIEAKEIDRNDSSVRFYVNRKEHDISTSLSEIEIEILYSGEVFIPSETYDLEWKTRVCNKCGGLKDDQEVTNASVEINEQK